MGWVEQGLPMAQEKLPSAVDVAKYILVLAVNDPEYAQKGLTQKQLQKILYYVQGWSLGNRDCRVFNDEIRAWREGPVVQDVYDLFKPCGTKYVPMDDAEIDLPPLTMAFIASIWEDYKGYSEQDLIGKTHLETPWIRARRGFRPHEPSDVPMPDSELREFFSQPSLVAIGPEELRDIASRPRNAPEQSWYDERDQFDR